MNCPLGLWEGARTPILSKGNGADDETTGCVVEGDGEEDQLGRRGRDHRGDLPDDEAVAGTDGRRGLQRTGGPTEGQAEWEAGAAQNGRAGAGAVPGHVLRPEHAALPREAARE